MTPYSDQKGVALFLSVLVMGVVALAVLLELTQGSINAIADVHDQSDAALARAAAFGCLDEVLIQLVGDSAWSEASVTLPTTTCAVTAVSGNNGHSYHGNVRRCDAWRRGKRDPRSFVVATSRKPHSLICL